MRKIRAEIKANGKTSLDFIGFVGEQCTEEEERIRKAMLDLGVMLEPKRIKIKTDRQIGEEIKHSQKI